MLCFRSEAHLDKWLADWHLARGEVLSLEQCWRLARAWYSPDRRAANWRRNTAEEAETLFARLGLTSSFWSLHSQAPDNQTR